MIRAFWISVILSVAVVFGAAAAGSSQRLDTPKTAEWEGEWVSVSSQIAHLERRGIFTHAAAGGGVGAADIRRAFQKRFGSTVERVRISGGRFMFLSSDGSIVIGTAQYTYAGFTEQMIEGREIQWHRFTIADGFAAYPVLICSEPFGMIGQWVLISATSTAAVKDGRREEDAGKQAMMVPADLSGEALAQALDTEEFVAFLRSLPISQKKEGRGRP